MQKHREVRQTGERHATTTICQSEALRQVRLHAVAKNDCFHQTCIPASH